MITEMIIGGLLMHTFPTPRPVKPISIQKSIILKSNEYSFIIGDNSIGEPILGGAYSLPMVTNVDFVMGGYFQDSQKFEEVGIEYLFGDFVPIIGIGLTFPINKTFGVSATITIPVIYTGLSVRF